MIPIFVSRPNPFTLEQDYFLNKLLELLKKNNLMPITLKAKEYNPHESLTCLNEMIKRCYGIVILGFGQVYISQGISKKGGLLTENFFDARENMLDNTWITSPFCHIEGAIAFSNNLPIMITTQNGIKLDGMLKEGSHAIMTPPFSLDSAKKIDEYFTNKQFLSDFEKWQQKISSAYDFINNSNVR